MTSFRVLFTTLRTPSHFLPLVPFVGACRARGHEVAVAAPADLEARVKETGARFFPFGHPGDQGLAPIWARMREVSGEEMTRIAIGELFAGICAKTALPGLVEAVESYRPSVIIRESQEYAAVVAAKKANVPHARVSITDPSQELAILRHSAPAVNEHRRGLGLPEDPEGMQIRNEPALTLFPRGLEGGEHAANVLRFRAPRNPAPPLPRHWKNEADPFVYATLGTVAGSMEAARQAYEPVIQAARGLPARVLLTVGNSFPLESLADVPENVHVERFVPQDDVLPHAALAICHGGSGTVIGALAAGVPMVVTPLFADQPQNAARIAAVGAGIALPTRGATAESIRRAVLSILREPPFRDRARAIAAEIADLPPIDEAGAAIERLAAS
ncbi:MAG TPA: glycosyltransferase [Polyangiaceae bacterium]|nr:glycosyltransferase [Polyangiaceae bacterium]